MYVYPQGEMTELTFVTKLLEYYGTSSRNSRKNQNQNQIYYSNDTVLPYTT
jgi:hypothetical protein